MPREREFEVKFAVEPEAMTRLAAHPQLGGAGPAPPGEHLVSTYYDTAHADLRRRRISLRVRRGEHATVQTLKRSGASLVDRDEWETTGGSDPDIAWLRSTPLASLFADNALLDTMDRRFTVDVRRTVLPIAFGETIIECALDRGLILTDNSSLPVHEIELEHKGGPRAGIVELSRLLARDLPLVLSLSSKAERGYAVADRTWERPSKDIPLDLSGARTLEQLFAGVVQGCLHALCRNAALIGGAEDGDAVHKARIALRHLRAAFALFEPILRRKAYARLRREVKWMSDRLGAARDGDVFQALVGASESAAALGTILEPHRRRAHSRLGSAMASARWRLLLVDLLAFSLEGVRRSHRARRAAPFARQQVRKLRSRLGRDARALVDAPPDLLHDLRKRAKMLRYDLDLVGTLPALGVAARDLRRTGRDLQVMQEVLGAIHDDEALAARLQDAVLAREAVPKGIDRAAWPEAVAAARVLCSRQGDPAALGVAAKAAKHLRKRSF